MVYITFQFSPYPRKLSDIEKKMWLYNSSIVHFRDRQTDRQTDRRTLQTDLQISISSHFVPYPPPVLPDLPDWNQSQERHMSDAQF